MPTGLASTARKTPAESASASTSRTKKTGAPRETMEEKRADALRQLEAGKSVRHYLRDHDHSRDDDTPVSLTAIREAVGGDISFDTIRTVRAVVRAER